MSDESMISVLEENCPTYSLGSFIAQTQNKSCFQLTESDLFQFLDLLMHCSYFYHNGTLSPNCFTAGCPDIPERCSQSEAVYSTLHFISDSSFLQPESIFGQREVNSQNSWDKLTYANIVIRINDLSSTQYFYNQKIRYKTYSNDEVKLVGIDDKFKIYMFDIYVLSDMLYFVLATVLVTFVSLLYLRSIILTIALLFDIGFSYIIAYFLYHIVFRFNFFPFLNIMAGLAVIAIAADDVFLYNDAWKEMKQKYPVASVDILIAASMKHAGLSIFVTSLTTSAAFFANNISDITVIKCFAVFTGIAIMSNFLLMLTWIPSILALMEKQNQKQQHIQRTPSCINNIAAKFSMQVQKIVDYLFKDVIPKLIDQFNLVWLFLLFSLGIGGIIVVFVSPKLSLPSDAVFKLFGDDTLVEYYDQELKFKFNFKQQEIGMDVFVVWGIAAQDNGDHLDPDSNGSLIYDKTFQLGQHDSQEWMSNFCDELKQADFISKESASLPCTLNMFKHIMMTPCPHESFQPCCGHTTYPFMPELFEQCFHTFITNNINTNHDVLGVPFFSDSTNKTNAFIFTFISNQVYSGSFPKMDSFFNTLETFMNQHLSTAPSGVKNGWIISNFSFYDIQQSLGTATMAALGISIAVALIVMFITTLNAVIVLYAMVTVSLTVFVTEGILVLNGWELNIFESMILSLAVGFSIDFSIHFGVGYRLSEKPDRKSRTRESIAMVGGPVLMSMITTFLAGASLLPSGVNTYRQLGTFLMLVMVSSWVFSTFFFQSLCRVAGPQGNFAQIRLTCFDKKKDVREHNVDGK